MSASKQINRSQVTKKIPSIKAKKNATWKTKIRTRNPKMLSRKNNAH